MTQDLVIYLIFIAYAVGMLSFHGIDSGWWQLLAAMGVGGAVASAIGERLARLVNNVLSFSRLEQGRKTANPEELDAVRSLHEVLEGQRERLDAAGMEEVNSALRRMERFWGDQIRYIY